MTQEVIDESPVGWQKSTVLIVDDDAVNLRLLVEILQDDYRVLVATSGEQALKLLEKHRDVHLMLLDVDMPSMSGFDVLQVLKQQPAQAQLPVILVTARNQVDDEVFGLEQGAVDYISKPISAAVVKARVKTQLHLAHAQRELTSKNFELEKALEASKAAKDELTEFTAMVSHELRTPVAILLCEIELLLDGIRKPDKKNLESLQEEVKHFSNLINDLFDLVLSEGRALIYDKKPCHLDSLVHRSMALFESKFLENGIAYTINLEPLSKLFVFADPQRIRQVIDNIFKNTLKYTDSNGQLSIFGELKAGWLWLHFQDSSPGVEPDDIDKIFNKLYRVEASRNRATGGAGLGLAICRTIILDHAGKILARASPLGGLWISIGMPEYHQ